MSWACPLDPEPWREPQCREFNQAARQVLENLRAGLSPAWEVRDEHHELHQDPDLGRYLADPAAFDRAQRR